MSNPEKSGDGSNFDFDDMGGDVDPFADTSKSGEADPFDFSDMDVTNPAGKSSPTAPSPKAPRPPAPSGAAKPPPPSAPKTAAASPAKTSRNPSGMAALAEDVPVQVVAVLGKKTVTVGDLISLKKGEVVELNRFPNEAVDLVANGKLMAKGELVEIDGKLGVRIIKIF